MTASDSARLQPRIQDPPELRITSPHLVAVIKTMAEFWQELREIDETAELIDDPNFTNHPDDPPWAELYEAQVAELAGHIGAIEIRGGDR